LSTLSAWYDLLASANFTTTTLWISAIPCSFRST
jgi:hypothetical protein